MFALVSKLPDWGNYKMDFISMVKEAVEAGCSDIHMSAGNCPAYLVALIFICRRVAVLHTDFMDR